MLLGILNSRQHTTRFTLRIYFGFRLTHGAGGEN